MRERWERRATELNVAIGSIVSEGSPWDPELPTLKKKRSYALARVARLNADIGPRLDWCGTESLPVRCGCGYVGARKTCRQWWLCGECRYKRSRGLQADIRHGLDAALSAERDEWAREGARGQEPQIFLITLTQKHSGNLSKDQDALASGWRKLYKRMHEEYGAFSYVGVWEVTRGRDGLGHVHMHIAVVWRYRDWWRINEQWRRACPTSRRITFVPPRKKKDHEGKPLKSTAASVANYLGAYLTKGCDVAAFDPKLRAEVSAAFYNQRSVISSSHFFRKRDKCCRKCNERYRLEEMPRPTLADLIPGGQTIVLDFTRVKPPPNTE